MIRHIVNWKLDATDPADRQRDAEQIGTRLMSLVPLIPAIAHLQVGVDLGETPGNWDVVLVADFPDREGLEEYQSHPAHVEVAGFIRSVVAQRSCVDFEL